MGEIHAQKPVKLIIGFIFKEEGIYGQAKKILASRFGALDFESEKLPFSYTRYYEPEFGPGLFRRFIGLRKLITLDNFWRIKVISNKIELKLSRDNKRRINIDPGYLDLAKLVLASSKDYVHRIYLNRGVFAEMTLFYRDKSFQPWQWTYPDYRSLEYIKIFNSIRAIYEGQLKSI